MARRSKGRRGAGSRRGQGSGGAGKQPLRTSRQVHDQIRWDATLDERAFTVAYEERFSGLVEVPFPEFPTDGTVPWHRVWRYRVGELVVWSRRERVDLLHGSGRAAADVEAVRAAISRARVVPPVHVDTQSSGRRRGPAPPPVGREPLEPRPAYRFDPGVGRWRPAPPGAADASAPPPESLTVVTLNLLFDLHDDGRLASDRRLRAALELLAGAGADVIALEEVTPRSLAALQACPWVRDACWLSDVVDTRGEAPNVSPYGQVLIARAPMRCAVARLRGHKRAVFARLELGRRALHVAAVHLTSDRADDAAVRRADELAAVMDHLDALARADDAASPRCLLIGDFNTRDDALDEPLRARGYTDLWTAAHPEDPGYTFDPRVNGAAAIMSRTGLPGRLDRMLVRAPPAEDATADWLNALDISRVATEPLAPPQPDLSLPLYPSDHFGLCALFQLAPALPPVPDALRDAAPVYRSALAIVPPQACWPEIQAIRRAHDRAYERWMPHINVLYGFVPDALLDQAAALVREALADLPPFTITLRDVRAFPRRRGATVWLEPTCEPADALQRLFDRLVRLFPRCDEQRRKSGVGFTPHLTIGQLTRVGGTAEGAAASLETFSSTWSEVRFEVDHVALMSRRGDEPFVVRHEVPLGRARATRSTTPRDDASRASEMTDPTSSLPPSSAATRSASADAASPAPAASRPAPRTSASADADAAPTMSAPLAATTAPPSLPTASAPLGSAKTSPPTASPAPASARATAHATATPGVVTSRTAVATADARQRGVEGLLAQLERACIRCIHGAEGPPGVLHVHLVGSRRLGVADEEADVDIVCAGPSWYPRDALFAALPAALRDAGLSVQARAVEDAVAPRLELVVDGTDVDVQHLRFPEGQPLGDPGALGELDRLDRASQLALLSMRDIERLLAHIERQGRWPRARFLDTLRRLRAWTRARDLDRNALGYPGGLAWAVLLAATLEHVERADIEGSLEPRGDATTTTSEALLGAFFRRRAALGLSSCVALTPDTPPPATTHPSPLVILTPAAPHRNLTRAATRTTASVVRDELRRAVGLAARDRTTRASPFDHERCLVITIDADDEDALARARGWLFGHIVALFVSLERALRRARGDASLRPYSHQFTRARADALERARSRALLVGLEGAAQVHAAPVEDALRAFRRAFRADDASSARARLELRWRETEELVVELAPVD